MLWRRVRLGLRFLCGLLCRPRRQGPRDLFLRHGGGGGRLREKVLLEQVVDVHGAEERVVDQERLLRVGGDEERMGNGGVLVLGQRTSRGKAARVESVWGIQGAI